MPPEDVERGSFSAGAPGAPCGPAGPGTVTTVGGGTTTVGRSHALNASTDTAAATTIEYFMICLSSYRTRTARGIAHSRPDVSVFATAVPDTAAMRSSSRRGSRVILFSCAFLLHYPVRRRPSSCRPSCPWQTFRHALASPLSVSVAAPPARPARLAGPWARRAVPPLAATAALPAPAAK